MVCMVYPEVLTKILKNIQVFCNRRHRERQVVTDVSEFAAIETYWTAWYETSVIIHHWAMHEALHDLKAQTAYVIRQILVQKMRKRTFICYII
jgi:hypothetical protein